MSRQNWYGGSRVLDSTCCPSVKRPRRPAWPRRRSFEKKPVIVPRVTDPTEQGLPVLDVVIGLGRQHPLLEQAFLVARAPGVHDEEGMPPADALDLAHGLLAPLRLHVVDRVDRRYQVEGPVR